MLTISAPACLLRQLPGGAQVLTSLQSEEVINVDVPGQRWAQKR